ncbi:hypothetical protein ACFE04_002879 [Oxalis oulophora]
MSRSKKNFEYIEEACSSSPLHSTTSKYQQYKKLPATSSFHASLHTVRKSPAKPWKEPIAPLPPNPTRLYKVHPVNFMDLVQKLTGAAPPHINVSDQQFETYSLSMFPETKDHESQIDKVIRSNSEVLLPSSSSPSYKFPLL